MPLIRIQILFVSFHKQICYEPCFDQLRTKDQLGYSVGCTSRNVSGSMGFSVQVVSALHAPAFVDARIDAFLAWFGAELRGMSAATFAERVQSFVTQKEADHSLQDESARLWDEIADSTFVFDRPAREAAFARDEVDQAKMVAFFERHVLSPAHRCKFGMWVFGANRTLLGADGCGDCKPVASAVGSSSSSSADASTSASSDMQDSSSASSLSASSSSSSSPALLPAASAPCWSVSGPVFGLCACETLNAATGLASGAEHALGGARRIVDWVAFKRTCPLFPDFNRSW